MCMDPGELLGSLRARCVSEHPLPSVPKPAWICSVHTHTCGAHRGTLLPVPIQGGQGNASPGLQCRSLLVSIRNYSRESSRMASAAPLSALGFSELSSFGLVHQATALGSTLKVSVAAEDLSFLLVRDAELCDKPLEEVKNRHAHS